VGSPLTTSLDYVEAIEATKRNGKPNSFWDCSSKKKKRGERRWKRIEERRREGVHVQGVTIGELEKVGKEDR